MTYSSAAAAGDTGYYTGIVGKSREEYYLGPVKGGNPAGRWGGELAKDVGLTGEVVAEDMAHVFGTLTGPNGERLGQGPSTKGRYAPIEVQVAKWIEANPRATPEEAAAAKVEIESKARTGKGTAVDVTYSLPKSMSLVITAYDRAAQEAEARGDLAASEALYSFARELEGDVLEAHRATMQWLESSGVLFTHVGHYTGGKDGADRYSPVTGLLYTEFPQRESQEGDPQFHVHTPTVMRARAADGKIRRLEGLVAKGGSGVKFAMSAMTDRGAAELWAARGLPMEMRPDGIAAECTLVSPELAETFSKRTYGQINPYMADLMAEFREQHGREPGEHDKARMHRKAKVATRGRKVGENLTRAEKLAKYEAEAWRESGHSLVDLAVRAEQARARGPVKVAKWSPEQVKAEAVARVMAEKSTFTRESLVAAVHSSLPANAFSNLPREQILPAVIATETRLAEEILASGEVVQVAGLGIEAPEIEAAERYGSPARVRFAARGTMAAEQTIRDAARESGGVAMTRTQAEAWLAEHGQTLGADQREAFLKVATSRAFLSVIEAPAGTGKSYLVGKLAEAHEAAHGAGTVVGSAIGSRQASVLAEEGLGNTANTTVMLNALDRMAAGKPAPGDERFRLGPSSILFVDEASQLTTDHGRRMLDHYRAAGARLVLIQDPRQRQAVGAGGVPGILEGHAETSRLVDVRRFSNEWEKAASLRLRTGDASVLAEYDRRGRLVGVQTPEQALERAALGVFTDLSEGLDSIAVAGSNAEAGQVSSLVRAHLVAAGLVDAEGVDLADERGGGVAGRGDRIQLRNNDHSLDVENRQFWTVEQILDAGGLRVVHPQTGELKDLPADYVAKDVALAYAGTVDAVQGVTVDREHGVFTGRPVSADGVYVPMTRGRDANTAYVVCPENEHGERPSARAVLAGYVETDREDVAAIVAAERDEMARRSVSFVVGRLEDVTQQACTDRLSRHLDMLAGEGTLSEADRARFTGDDKGYDHLTRRIRSLEQAGHDPEAVLRKVVEGRPLTGASSVGMVLSARLGETFGTPEPTGDLAGVSDETPAPVRMAAPVDVDETYAARLANLSAMIEERTAELGREVAEEAPAWAVGAFGAVPVDQEALADWQAKAGQVAAARESAGWTDPDRALPAAPSVYNTERRALWGRGFDALGRPEEERAEATMTEGQLRVRMKAWDRLEATGPANVDAAMTRAYREIAEYREKAANPKAGEAERQEAQKRAEEAAEVAQIHERQAKIRDDYLGQHRGTKEAADRAAAEAERRGLVAEEEAPDLTTAAEWLGLEVEARAEDDEHREISETDMAPVGEHQAEGDHAAAIEQEQAETIQPPAEEDWLTVAQANILDANMDKQLDWLAEWESQSETGPSDAWAEPDPWAWDEPARQAGDELEIGGVG